ncbi:MAG: HAD family hydrolase [Treponema sp.]|nr:HAD family hydrolase [Treponema sp.]
MNNLNYSVAIFDMDGTILDTLEDLSTAINKALVENSLPERSIEEVKGFVGNGLYKLVERAVPASSSDEVKKAVFKNFNDYYALHSSEKTKPYPGIVELLKKLKEGGVKIAVCSNKPDYAVQELCNIHFPSLFDAALGAKDKEHVKPCPDAVNRILEKLDIPASEAVYIGDSEVDIQTAENAGTACISVCWGFKSREFLVQNGAKCIVNSAEELSFLLLGC